MVQDVHEGGLPPGRQRVRLPLLEEHAARLQELGQNCALQLEGELEVFQVHRDGHSLYQPNGEKTKRSCPDVRLFKLVHNQPDISGEFTVRQCIDVCVFYL